MRGMSVKVAPEAADETRRHAVPNRGPFASEDDALRAVVRRLVDQLNPDEIWLFGSRAEGVHQPDSDFDLLVVTSASADEAAFDFDRVYAPIKGWGVGCEIVPCRADEFALERNDPTSLCWRVVNTGWKLYERGAPGSGIPQD
jgi:predicted nucleotidyltransferase